MCRFMHLVIKLWKNEMQVKGSMLDDASLVQGSLSTYSSSGSATFDRSRPKSWKSKSCLQHFLHDHRKMTGTWCFLIFESKDQVFAHSLFFQASFHYLRRKLQQCVQKELRREDNYNSQEAFRSETLTSRSS